MKSEARTIMKKVGVIIKHPFRTSDWRIDIYEVPKDMSNEDIGDYAISQMLAPFEIMAITEQISFDCKIKN